MYDCEIDEERKDVIFCDIWDISKNQVPVTKYGKVDGAVGDTKKRVVRNRIQGIMAHGKRPKLYLYKSLPTVQVCCSYTSCCTHTKIHFMLLLWCHRKERTSRARS
jgi:hypothetical protein